MSEVDSLQFLTKKHVSFFKRCLHMLPGHGDQTTMDTTRLTLAFFALSGLDLLNSLDVIKADHQAIIEWIYSLQVLPENGKMDRCGFRGSSTLFSGFNNSDTIGKRRPYDNSHIAMTYTALTSLALLGDDLSRVNRKAVLCGVGALQQDDGSFDAMLGGSENDMRFVYCASCICFMLQDWSTIDVPRTINYIISSLTYEGGFAQGPGLEAHGGPTFCAVASLYMMNRLDAMSKKQLDRLLRWLVFLQEKGYHGRPNKPDDTCYSFWVGATLQLLGFTNFGCKESNRSFVLSTQCPITGGLSKYPNSSPDPLHTYLGLSGLSFLQEPALRSVFPALNISHRAYDHLKSLQEKWKK